MAQWSSIKNFAGHFARCYLRAVPSIIYRISASCVIDPRGSQRFLHAVLDRDDYTCNDPVLGTIELQEFLPGTFDVELVGPYQTGSTSETNVLREIADVAHIMHALDPKLVFEFGTFIGRMTRLMAHNAVHAQVVTLDLPQDQVKHTIGSDYRGRPEEPRITQLHGDSRTVDLSAWKGRCDFIWVDANHDYPFVVSDTRRALELARPGGWIAWHDYRLTAAWSGVTQAVQESRASFDRINHLRGTSIVLAQCKK